MQNWHVAARRQPKQQGNRMVPRAGYRAVLTRRDKARDTPSPLLPHPRPRPLSTFAPLQQLRCWAVLAADGAGPPCAAGCGGGDGARAGGGALPARAAHKGQGRRMGRQWQWLGRRRPPAWGCHHREPLPFSPAEWRYRAVGPPGRQRPAVCEAGGHQPNHIASARPVLDGCAERMQTCNN